jgi:hypothetical protein
VLSRQQNRTMVTFRFVGEQQGSSSTLATASQARCSKPLASILGFSYGRQPTPDFSGLLAIAFMKGRNCAHKRIHVIPLFLLGGRCPMFVFVCRCAVVTLTHGTEVSPTSPWPPHRPFCKRRSGEAGEIGLMAITKTLAVIVGNWEG